MDDGSLDGMDKICGRNKLPSIAAFPRFFRIDPTNNWTNTDERYGTLGYI